MAIELHVIEEEYDLTSYLLLFVHDDSECENCGRSIETNPMRFYPFVICIDDEDNWIVCTDCAKNVIYPGE